jgi:cyclopropane fatty-acyl-phospholipid synthase-like methyltransferase
MNKPYAEACDRNKAPILAVIKLLFEDCTSVLEIGSGTGQHAVYFAEKLPHLVWHTSDVKENHADIRAWLQDAKLSNLQGPLSLDVMQAEWPPVKVDAVFSANTAHIMHWEAVEKFFAGVGKLLPEGGKFVLYGPFNYQNQYTSDSNANFDLWLKARDPHSGIRNFEDLDNLAKSAGLMFRQDYEMPANNRILYWQKNNRDKIKPG